MSKYQGPSFRLVESVTVDEFDRQGGANGLKKPLLVKGAVKRWPAWKTWSFDELSKIKNKDGSDVMATFQNGLIEQGVTKKPVHMPIAPYLKGLESSSLPNKSEIGLCPENIFKGLKTGEDFYLNWEYLKTFPADQVYLAQWQMLQKFPELKKDFALRTLWKKMLLTWEYLFIGPAQTVTGLHDDFGNNWFCQVRGLKEFILFTPDNDSYLCQSEKYDWGARLSRVDITKIDQQPQERVLFEKAKGLYARVEAGDALFIPKYTWHGVVALEPSISLAVFGLTALEIMTDGLFQETLLLLHNLGLYKKGNCACHKMIAKEKKDIVPLVAD